MLAGVWDFECSAFTAARIRVALAEAELLVNTAAAGRKNSAGGMRFFNTLGRVMEHRNRRAKESLLTSLQWRQKKHQRFCLTLHLRTWP